MSRIDIVGKRIMALDYGRARIGVAVCDPLHIVISTRPVIENRGSAETVVAERIAAERADIVLVGVPLLHDGRVTDIIAEIQAFVVRLRATVAVPVIEVDEAFTTAAARGIMLASGMSKKRRATKGRKDVVAAAVMLRDFLEEQS